MQHIFLGHCEVLRLTLLSAGGTPFAVAAEMKGRVQEWASRNRDTTF